VIIYDANGCWDGSNYLGASFLSLTKLCNLHGYSLVYCNENGVNAFFVRDTLIKERGVEFKNINNQIGGMKNNYTLNYINYLL
jgi:hypothetical protein